MNACGNVRRLSRRGLLPLFALSCFVLATLPAQGAPPAGTRELDDLRYVLGSEWVVEDLRGGGPELRAHYAMKVRGQPCGELYVSSESVARGQTLEQVLQAGIEKTRDKLPDYQPLGTKRTKAGDFDAVVHDFGYTVGVPFRGRVYVLLAGGSSYSFFFNTTAELLRRGRGHLRQGHGLGEAARTARCPGRRRRTDDGRGARAAARSARRLAAVRRRCRGQVPLLRSRGRDAGVVLPDDLQRADPGRLRPHRRADRRLRAEAAGRPRPPVRTRHLRAGAAARRRRHQRTLPRLRL